jgi:aminoglycoside phosphotransferase (APT) family kinase protein
MSELTWRDMKVGSDILPALRRMGLAGPDDDPSIDALPGGVSCDVFRVALGDRTLCVKRALARLRVAAEWRAPVERVHNEVAWLNFAASLDPDCVPTVLGEDREAHLFAMVYLEPEHYPCWKTLMLAGTVEPSFAGQVGAALAAIHAASAGRKEIAAKFAQDELFLALRLDPYLLYTAGQHPDRGERLRAIADGIAKARVALMQGDISPKNILKGPSGPVFLDAETACYGDPAFDVAFCLNHLLLKAVLMPQRMDALFAAFEAFRSSYFGAVDWEGRDGLDSRAAAMLSAFLLARIDGKSPVEYLTSETAKAFVRAAARAYLEQTDLTLRTLSADWQRRLARA